MKKKLVIAKVFIVNANGHILAVRRSITDFHRPLTWDLPGGEVEYGEDPIDAVTREANEEVGLHINKPQIIDVSSSTSKMGYVIRLLFSAEATDQEIKLSFEHDRFKWVSLAEFNELNIPIHYKEASAALPG